MKLSGRIRQYPTLAAASAVWLACSIALASCGFIEEKKAYIYGLQSYVYGYPLVMMDVTRKVLTAAPAPNATGTAAPINQLARMPTYVSPDFKNVVRISLNSLWTTGFVDLKEPVVLTVPDNKDRYYVFSVMNMWTDVFASVGTRTTGTGAGNFLFAGPDWKGTAPPDIKQVFRSSTRYAWMLGQTQANGPSDFAFVRAIGDQYQLTPLSAWGKPYTPPNDVAVDPEVNLERHAARSGREDGRADVLQPAGDGDEGQPAVRRRQGRARKAQEHRRRAGQAIRHRQAGSQDESGARKGGRRHPRQDRREDSEAQERQGWILFQTLGRYGTDYETRAGVAFMGLGANMREDTIYPTAYLDGSGNPLDSAYKYVMHFDKGQLPPTNATWSVSQYKGNFYERNVLDRYAISPWMPLKFNPDGSLDIYLQADSPGADKESNWLPTPPGQFNLTLRNYYPKEVAYDGTYKVPPVRKIQ